MASFSKNFKSYQFEKKKIPTSVLDCINKKYTNVKYEYDKEHGIYKIVPKNIGEGINIQFKNYFIENEEDIRSKCGGELTLNKLQFYLYNSQKPLCLKRKKDSEIYVDDVKSESGLIIDQSGLKTMEESIKIMPPKMDSQDCIKIKLGFSIESSREFMFYRKPIDSFYQIKYETTDRDEFKITLIFDKNKVHTSIKINNNIKVSHQKYLENLFFVECIFEKGLYFNEAGPIQIEVSNGGEKRKLISFYSDLVDVEKVIGKEFKIDKDITQEQFYKMKIWHRILVEKKPWKKLKSLNSITSISNEVVEKQISELMKLNREFAFGYLKEEKDILFGIEKTFYTNNVGLHLKIARKEERDGDIVVYFEQNDKNSYQLVMGFESKEDLDEFLKLDNALSIMESAQEIDMEGKLDL